jgi:Protein of unknown function (DUF3102)
MQRVALKTNVRTSNIKTIDTFVAQINQAWQKGPEGIIEAGRILNEAKDALQHGQWGDMVAKLRFSSRMAQRLMKIANNPILSNPTHVSHLPPSWSTLYRLCELPDQVLEEMLADGKLHCEITREQVNEIHKKPLSLG